MKEAMAPFVLWLMVGLRSAVIIAALVGACSWVPPKVRVNAVMWAVAGAGVLAVPYIPHGVHAIPGVALLLAAIWTCYRIGWDVYRAAETAETAEVAA